MHILLSIRQQEVAEVSDDKYETELTKMADSATEKGVNEISAGPKNMDDEFSKDEHGVTKANEERHHVAGSGKNTNRNAARNAARKSKKKARQNKKHGRR